ncbi:hypothetical protein ABZ403_05390 [Micromonospora zamorensis]|uniref:hypothetical protein n=1 Tax=Micromonospora zamorensis TaxID=709883 RepID=UPI0033EFD522
MPGASIPQICLDGFMPVSSGLSLTLDRTTTEVPPHVRDAPPVTGLVQLHLHQDALGSESVRMALMRQDPSTVARLSVSLAPEFSTTIDRETALFIADDLGVYLDLPERADLVDPADDRLLPITSKRGVTSSASATGVRVIPLRHLLRSLTTPVDSQAASGYEPMRGQLRLTSDNVEIGVPRAVADALLNRAAEPSRALAAPVAVHDFTVQSYADLMPLLDGLAEGQQAKVTAIASEGTHEVSATMHGWGLEVSAPLPRRPHYISVSLPAPAAALSELDLAWLDGVASAIQARLTAAQELSPDNPDVNQIDSIIKGLREEFVEARKAQQLPEKPLADAIFEANKEGKLQEWREKGQETARLLDVKAQRAVSPQARATYLLEGVLHREFWVETQALEAAKGNGGGGESSVDQDISPAEAGRGESIPLTRIARASSTDAERHKFIPLVRRILNPSADQVTDEQMATLRAYAEAAYKDPLAGKPVELNSLRRLHAYAVLKNHLEETRSRTGPRASIERKVTRFAEGLKLKATDDRRNELLRLALYLFGNEPSTLERLPETVIRNSHLFLDWAHRRYSKMHFGNLPPGPLPLDVLEDLVRGKLGPDASLNSWDVGRIAVLSDARRAWWEKHQALPKQVILRAAGSPGFGKATQLFSAVHTKWIARGLNDGDTKQDRNREVKALRALLEAAGPSVSVSDKDLERLVATRRRLFAKSWDRRYTPEGLSHYQQMARELLGRDKVTPTVLRDLAELTRPDSPLRIGDVDNPFNHRKIRQELANKALKNWKPGTETPGPRPNPGPDGRDYSRMVTGFHTIDVEQQRVAELTAWINQSVPFGGSQITEDVVRRKIESLFGQTLDDGTPLEIAIDGRIYDIRVWAIPMREPEVEPGSLPGKSDLFPGALEGRSYSYFEFANWAARMDGTFFDVGAVHRYLYGVRSDATVTYGQSGGSGRRVLSSTTKAKYQQVRIKEKLGWVSLDVNWALRVQERRTYHRKRDAVSEVAGVSSAVNSVRGGTLAGDEEGGRWIERIFKDGDGKPVTHNIRYAVPEFNLPYSKEQTRSVELAKKTDPDYGKKIPISDPNDFAVWKMDHAVTRIQLADQVIAAVRNILKPADYAFWKTHLERYLSNDELAMHFENLVRPDGERGYQQMFRVLLESDGRRLSLSLGAKDNSPITHVTKISQVSRSGETRIDRVRASVIRIQTTLNRDSAHRVTATESARLWTSRVARVGGRIQKPFGHKVGQFSQQVRTFTTRAVRVVDELQVALIDFDLELKIHHQRDKDLVAGRLADDPYGDSRDLQGFAHVMVHEDNFQKLSTGGGPAPRSSKPKIDDKNPDPHWWNPGAGWGLTMDVVDRLKGVEDLYDAIVPYLVKGGHLPKVATTARGGATTPWGILQKMPLTGELENNPGLDYRNWQTLIRELSEENLLARADEVMDSTLNNRGIVWIFRHPDSPIRMEKALTVTLTAKTLRTSYKEDTVYELQYGHMNTETTTVKDARVSAREGGLFAGAGGSAGGASMQGTLNTQFNSRQSENSGQTQSSSVLSDTDGQKMKSRSFTADIRWYWAVKPAGDTTGRAFAGKVDAKAIILQPGELNGTGPTESLGRLVVEPASGNEPPKTTDNLTVEFMRRAMNDPEAQSPITTMNATAYTVIGTWGAERLQAAAERALAGEREQLSANGRSGRIARLLEELESDPAVRSQQLQAFLSNAMGRQAYKGFLLRALTGATVAIPVGDEVVDLAAVLVGTPEIVKSWKPYTQQVTEAQAGKESGAENLWQAGGGAGGFIGKTGFRPTLEEAPTNDAGNSELAIGNAAYARLKGRGKVAVTSKTVGKYSGLFQDDYFVIVRSAVVHRVRVGKSVEWVAGEVLLSMKTTDVVPHAALFDNAELIADHIKNAKSTPPPAATLTSTVRSSSGQKHSSHGVTLWQMQVSGGNEQTGVAPLVKALAAAAEPFKSNGLATYVTSVPSSVNPFMGKSLDGGTTLFYNSPDSRTFKITLRAEQVGHASGSHASGSGAKSYTRANDALNEARRWNSTHAVAGGSGGLFQPDKPEQGAEPEGFDSGFVAFSLQGGFSRTTGRSDAHGSNLLNMEGVRTNNLTGYFQNVRFHGSIEETTPSTMARLKSLFVASDKVQKFDVTVRLIVNEPTGGSTGLGADQRPLDFGLSQTLPKTAQVVSIRGLAEMHAAIVSVKSIRIGRPKGTGDQLNYETFPKKLGAMLTDEGARFQSLSTAAADLDAGPGGFIVKARVAEVESLFWVEKAEIEKYNHGTDVVSHTAVDILRANGGASVTVAGPADLVNWVGATVSAGKQRSTNVATDQQRSNERRVWLRRAGPLFVVHARLQYEIEWPDRRGVFKIPAIGYMDVVVSKTDAQAMGIPDDALAAVMPADSRDKDFPGYAARAAAKPNKPSAAPLSAAHRVNTLLRRTEAGSFAAGPPPGVFSRVDITNYYMIGDGAHADPRGNRPASEHPFVWYELVRSDRELVFVLRVHLTGHPDAVSKVKELTREGVKSHLNKPGYRLPMADRQLRVEVQFVDAGQEHLTIPVVSAEAEIDQAWASGQSPAFYAHKVLRSIGAAGHQPPGGEDGVDAPLLVRPSDLQQVMDVLEPMWPWRQVTGGALVRSVPPQAPGAVGQAADVHAGGSDLGQAADVHAGGSDLGQATDVHAGGSDLGQATDVHAGGSDLSPEPDWLRMSLAETARPDDNIPNLLSDMPVTGAKSQGPPDNLRTIARQQPHQYFVWLSTARGAAVDRQVLRWLNERLEQLAQAGRTPIVVTQGRPELDVPGKSRSVPGETGSLKELVRKYGAAVVHQVPRSSGLSGGLNFGNSWAVQGSIPAAAVGRDADTTWDMINPAVVEAARSLIRPTVRPVPEVFGRLVWDTSGVRQQLELLRSRADLRDPAHLAEAIGMAERVPTSMNVALVKPLLRFGPDEEVVVQFTESKSEQQPSTLLQAVARLEAAGKLKDPEKPGDATGDLVDLVQAVRLGAVETEHKHFDFTVSLLRTIGQIKAGRFDDATAFVSANRGRLQPEQRSTWVEALAALKESMADATERDRLQKVLEAVYEC